MMWILTRVVGLPQTQGCPVWGWIWGCLELCRTSTFSGDSSIHPPSPLPWARPHFMSSVGPLHCPCSFSILDPAGDGAGLTSAGITCQGIANLCSSTTVWPSPRENHFSPCCRGCRVTPSVGLWWLWPQPGCSREGAGLFWSPVRGCWVLRQRCSCACSAAGHPAVWPLGTRGCPGAPPQLRFWRSPDGQVPPGMAEAAPPPRGVSPRHMSPRYRCHLLQRHSEGKGREDSARLGVLL